MTPTDSLQSSAIILHEEYHDKSRLSSSLDMVRRSTHMMLTVAWAHRAGM